jgi:hypothetical protein
VIGYIDFEDDPATALPLPLCHARDALCFAHSTAWILHAADALPAARTQWQAWVQTLTPAAQQALRDSVARMAWPAASPTAANGSRRTAHPHGLGTAAALTPRCARRTEGCRAHGLRDTGCRSTMRNLIHLTNRHRTPAPTSPSAWCWRSAGAINAGGFLVLHMYTSHMTGFASQLADALVLDNHRLLLNALGAILAFMAGAATCAVLVNWSRQRHLHSVYALPLMLEALLLFPFGLMGAATLRWNTPFAVPLTVLLLSFRWDCRTPSARRPPVAACAPRT